ncbi:MAG: hypothetical protein E7411_01515 [Ruminococcaceae bacterium]|nr:hypothetical protein [Oscillospiraceae bacterium]
MRYCVGASHWRVDGPKPKETTNNMEGYIREWYRQQLWLATDERVTILGHPWYNGRGLWYEDFNLIPRSMNMEIAAAIRDNKKFVECNSGFLTSDKMTEKFRVQYIEFLRELFEMGIRITYGSDSHHQYGDKHLIIEKYLSEVGFKEGDFSTLTEEDLW